MNEFCGMDCCTACSMKGKSCRGCRETDGHPFGGRCVAAEGVKAGGRDEMEKRKQDLIAEINALAIPDLRINALNLLPGFFVNLEYSLPNGEKAKLLTDHQIYWGNQVERPGKNRCYGIAADETCILVSEYGVDGSEPEIIVYKKRV